MNWRRLLRLRKPGRRWDGDVCRVKHPVWGWAYVAVDKNGNPDMTRPLKWVDGAPNDPEDGSGHYEEV